MAKRNESKVILRRNESKQNEIYKYFCFEHPLFGRICLVKKNKCKDNAVIESTVTSIAT